MIYFDIGFIITFIYTLLVLCGFSYIFLSFLNSWIEDQVDNWKLPNWYKALFPDNLDHEYVEANILMFLWALMLILVVWILWPFVLLGAGAWILRSCKRFQKKIDSHIDDKELHNK